MYLHTPTTPGTSPEGETVWVDTSLNYHVFDFECRLTASPIPSHSSSSRVPPAVPSPHCLKAMSILKDFPVSHGGYWRIHPAAAAFVREIFVGEEKFRSRPTNNALEAPHTHWGTNACMRRQKLKMVDRHSLNCLP